jgi:hypothetical protein
MCTVSVPLHPTCHPVLFGVCAALQVMTDCCTQDLDTAARARNAALLNAALLLFADELQDVIDYYLNGE